MHRGYEGSPALVARIMTVVSVVSDSGATGSSGAGQAVGRSGDDSSGITMECLPSSFNCPVTESSGTSVTTTDSLPPR